LKAVKKQSKKGHKTTLNLLGEKETNMGGGGGGRPKTRVTTWDQLS